METGQSKAWCGLNVSAPLEMASCESLAVNESCTIIVMMLT